MDEKLAAASGDAPSIEVDSKDLFKGGKLLLIRHNGDTYKLAITLTGKLILTK
jgi:hemin uptake protein HemP